MTEKTSRIIWIVGIEIKGALIDFYLNKRKQAK